MNVSQTIMPPHPTLSETYFTAPWGSLLKVLSLGFSVLMLLAALGASTQLLAPTLSRAFITLLPLAILLGCALFTVRGYRLRGDALWVGRLFWSTRVNLRGLRDARIDPQAASWSLRVFGNGGLFSFSGWYWNRRLGRYRMFATNFRQPVVLDLGSRRVVVSPGDAGRFVRELTRQHTAP
jgi:hypothetical protein